MSLSANESFNEPFMGLNARTGNVVAGKVVTGHGPQVGRRVPAWVSALAVPVLGICGILGAGMHLGQREVGQEEAGFASAADEGDDPLGLRPAVCAQKMPAPCNQAMVMRLASNYRIVQRQRVRLAASPPEDRPRNRMILSVVILSYNQTAASMSLSAFDTTKLPRHLEAAD